MIHCGECVAQCTSRLVPWHNVLVGWYQALSFPTEPRYETMHVCACISYEGTVGKGSQCI